LIGFLLLVVVMSVGILSTTGQFALMFAVVFFLGWLLRGRFLKIHARLQAALIDTLKEKTDSKPGSEHKEP
jgi:CPA2 family monovalent cation:H+ antiporter-2